MSWIIGYKNLISVGVEVVVVYFFFLLICIRRGLDFSGYALMDDGLIVVGTVGHSLKMLFSVFDA